MTPEMDEGVHFIIKDFRHCTNADWSQEIDGMCSCMLYEDEIVKCIGSFSDDCEFINRQTYGGMMVLEKE